MVKLPPWRKDVLHWVDISEDIAISYGYNKFEVTEAEVVTAGKLAQSTEGENLVRQILTGVRLVEVLNYTLSNKDALGKYVRREATWVDDKCVEISNPVSSTYNYVRPDLLPGLLRFASNNKHNEYPQKIFETGECVNKHKNGKNIDVITQVNASTLLSGVDETFETIQSTLDVLTRLLDLEYQLESISSNFYLDGRAANILIDGVVVGHIGEIHPEILELYGLEVPSSAFELNLANIPKLNIPSIATDDVEV